jgi:hypothetical protein
MVKPRRAENLQESTERLNRLLAKAEEIFSAANAEDGATAQVELAPFLSSGKGGARLHWKRHDSTWGLWVERQGTDVLVRLAKVARHVRVLAASKLEALFDALADEQLAQGDDVARAVQDAEAFVEEHEGPTSA